MTFAGKRIWIIGASAGIGAALARALAAEGARLILSARDGAALEVVAAHCPGAEILPLDLGRRDTLAAAVDRLRQHNLDAVISTAALYHPGRVSDLDPRQTEDIVRVNLLGALAVAQLTPPLIRDGGQLVLFGSVAGYFGLPRGQAYSATKAAVNNLAETLRIELAPRVDVRLVCPGFVRTRLTDKNDFAMPALLSPEEAAAEVLRGLSGRQFEIHFPKRFTLAVKALRALPYALSLRLTRRLGQPPAE
ncbi:SDR family NAD(P)-dependent oxidoreductase [Pseudodonghicola flavimaris]|uniref:SDR family NAD(P)-dependent oxidoreductase n=1 Tax=Pseudodonghicola flavimaris TaxID=3050036 RepID=A0ABT7F1W7_9RHOB|nr:SDR family NAD(P)-dependent oxidoreductase [Pseudodonghicola flavimaris]MDK3018593.1 SDR family NAD(P)-dependent oxidoreductase [Pseudodonghicola flavimaris]